MFSQRKRTVQIESFSLPQVRLKKTVEQLPTEMAFLGDTTWHRCYARTTVH